MASADSLSSDVAGANPLRGARRVFAVPARGEAVKHRTTAAQLSSSVDGSESALEGSRRARRLAEKRRRYLEDVVVVRAILGGDPDAFRTLVDRYQKPLFWLARDILLDRDESLDVVQETFVRVHAALGRYDQSRDFKNWIFRIARNLSIDMYRRRRRRPISVEDSLLHQGAAPSGVDSPGGHASQDDDHQDALDLAPAKLALNDMQRRVHDVIALLPVEYRLALTLREFHGLSPREMARVTDCSYATARWRLHRARSLFRARWVDKFGTQAPTSELSSSSKEGDRS